MPSVCMEISTIRHPLVKSFRLKRDFGSRSKTSKILIVEAGFDLAADSSKGMDSKLMNLIADLRDLIPQIESRTGKFDCIDICPAQNTRENEWRLSA